MRRFFQGAEDVIEEAVINTVNSIYLFFSGASSVRKGIEHAKQLVKEDKLDEAMSLIRDLQKKYLSDSTEGIIGSEFDEPVIDPLILAVDDLISAGQYEQVLALYKKALLFYSTVGQVVNYLNSAALPTPKG